MSARTKRRIHVAYGRRLAHIMAVFALAAMTCVVAGAPAGAAGNRNLDRDIIADPIPGWQSLPASQVSQTASRIQAVESASLVGTGFTTATAAEGWQAPSSSSTFVLVILIDLSASGKSEAELSQQAALAAGAAAVSFCAGASGASPVSDRPLLSIPTSHQAVCADKALDGMNLGVVAWGKANVLALVASSTGLTRLDAVALQEYTAMPTTGSTVAANANSSSTPVIIGVVVGLIVVMLIGFGVLATKRRRRIPMPSGLGYEPTDFLNVAYPSVPPSVPPPSGPSAGWYPDPELPGRLRYWTGRDWGPSQTPPSDKPG